MVDIVIIRCNPSDVDRLSRIKAFSCLMEIQVDALVNLLLIEHAKLTKQLRRTKVRRCIRIQCLECLLDLIAALGGSLTLSAIRGGSRHLQINAIRSLTGNRNDVIQHLHRLTHASTKCRRTGKCVQIKTFCRLHMRIVKPLDFHFETKNIVIQNLHQVHR